MCAKARAASWAAVGAAGFRALGVPGLGSGCGVQGLGTPFRGTCLAAARASSDPQAASAIDAGLTLPRKTSRAVCTPRPVKRTATQMTCRSVQDCKARARLLHRPSHLAVNRLECRSFCVPSRANATSAAKPSGLAYMLPY